LRHARAVRPAKLGPVGGGEQWECGKEGYKESDTSTILCRAGSYPAGRFV